MRLFSCSLAFLAATVFATAQSAPKGPRQLKTNEDKANAANWPDNSKGSPTPHAPSANPPAATVARPQVVAPPSDHVHSAQP